MRKDRWMTVLGAAAACALALGGLALTQGLLERRQSELLSQSGQILMAEKEKEDAAKETTAALDAETLRQVLARMEAGSTETFHEPFGRQLSMREAVKKGRQWAEEFYGRYLGQGSATRGSLLQAVLATKEASTGGAGLPEDLYSYWTVAYRLEQARITLQLNAVTGQVLRAQVEFQMPNAGCLDEEEILEEYVNSFSLKESLVKQEDGRRIVMLEGGGLYAELRTSDMQIYNWESARKSWSTMRLYLCTEIES